MEALHSETNLRNEGRCTMRGSCGPKVVFGKPLPCPYDGPPTDTNVDRDLLVNLCGADLAQGPTCCTTDQLVTLIRKNPNR